jgi:ADP-ribose pyrophosphatase YjhB (NUDIX family)
MPEALKRREISAGCVVHRRSKVGLEVALIRPRGREVWALPKGLLEPGEAPERAAAREVEEETGLTGEIGRKIETLKYSYDSTWETPPARVFKIVTFYLLRATGGDPTRHDQEVEAVAWFPIDEAVRRAAYRGEKDVLRKAGALLAAQDSSGPSGPETGGER